ncbi:MAG: DUF58 domain-containing protein [Burkholderiales bacterium]
MSGLVRFFPSLYRLSQWSDRRFTPAGKVVMGAALAAAVFGIDTTRSASYQVFAVAAGMLMVSWLLSSRWRPRITAVRHVPSHAIVGARATYTVSLSAGAGGATALQLRDEFETRFPDAAQFRAAGQWQDTATNAFDRRVGFLRWLSLTERLRGGTIAPVALASLRASASVDVTLAFSPTRRGVIRFAALRLLRPDPLGLVNATWRVGLPQDLVVLPRIHPVPRLALPGTRRRHRGENRTVPQVGESQEFLQLRDYRAGDPVRRIHWPSSARAGRLVVKETGEEFFARHALVLDTFADGIGDDVFEAAVSVAASVAGGLDLGEAFLDLMFVDDRVVTVSAGRQGAVPLSLLRELAFVSAASRGSFADLQARVLARSPEISACIHVFLSLDAPRAALVKALASRGIVQLVLAVDCDPSRRDLEGVPVHPVDRGDVGASLAALTQWRP